MIEKDLIVLGVGMAAVSAAKKCDAEIIDAARLMCGKGRR